MIEVFDSNAAKELVCQAFEEFGKTRRLSEPNESETRCELIDQILTAVGWEPGGFAREVSTGTGDYVDYELPRSKTPQLVIEAKRFGTSFALDDNAKRETGRTLAIKTLMRNGGRSLREAFKQAAGYCNDRAIPYACVTNGFQWLFFRGLSSEAQSWNEGRAVVFSSSNILVSNFDDFLACIAPHRINSYTLPKLLSRPTSQEVSNSVIPIEKISLRYKSISDKTLDARRQIGQKFFAQIHGLDRATMSGTTMLESCYVEPGGRPDFSRNLQRLLSDTLSRDIAESEENTHESNKSDFVNQIKDLENSGRLKYPILVVGNVGVGKTTFLYHTIFSLREVSCEVLENGNKKSAELNGDTAMYAYIDLENQGNLEKFDDQKIQREIALLILEKLSQSALSTLKKRDDISDKARLQADPDDEQTLQTMLRKRLKKERNRTKSYFERNPDKWDDKEYEIIQDYRKDTINFLFHYIRHLRSRFKRRDELSYPILLVLDNLDQASSSFQRCIYSLALLLSKDTPAITIYSIREDTFREGRQPSGFLSSSPLEFVFHVQAPALDKLLKQRIKFIKYCLKHDELPRGLRNSSEEIHDIVRALNKGLVASPRSGLEVISALSGHNIRLSLHIVREFILGSALISSEPEPTVDYLLEALIAIAGELNHKLDLKKLFDADPYAPPLHELRLRLLGYFSWALDQHPDRSTLEDTEIVISKFSAWGYPIDAVEQSLQSLYSQKLLNPIDLKECQQQLPKRMSISSTGYAHLTRLAPQKIFRTAMALICRWYDNSLVEQFILKSEQAGTEDGTSLGDIVSSNAVSIFEAYLKASKKRENRLLSEKFSQQPWVKETISRSNVWNKSTSITEEISNDSERNERHIKIDDGSQQLSFDIHVQTKQLPRLPRNLKLHSSVWVSRILWALEYADINELGPQTAAQIAKILTEQGDVDVPNTNVAREFRKYNKEKPEVKVYYTRQGKRYSITKEGSNVIRSCIESEYGVSD